MNTFFDDILKETGRAADEDYYKILGCDELSTDEQLQCEYKVRALELHPDKNPNNSEAALQFQKLQAAKDVLLDSEKRRKYDKWRKSGLMMPFQQYLNLNITSLHWVTKKTKEPMLTESAHQSSTTGLKSCEPQGSLSSWRKEEPASELLKKFRNYEI
ncbi:unnamed protein product [Ixodes pacificus]|uniref:Putative molecular chaperone n=1 Tax=Ixodes ricinus TaxID=34613 RepID=A0A0K8RL78_IXORI